MAMTCGFAGLVTDIFKQYLILFTLKTKSLNNYNLAHCLVYNSNTSGGTIGTI